MDRDVRLVQRVEDRTLLSAIHGHAFEDANSNAVWDQGPYGQPFELSSLLPQNGGDGTTGVVMEGLNAANRFGWSASAAGDVNADGIDDFIIGAIDGNHPVYGTTSGTAYVVFGQAAGFNATIDLASLNGSNGFVLHSIPWVAGDFGMSVASGDINGDGIDDMLVGSFNTVHVLFGSSLPFASAIDLSQLNGTDGFRVWGPSSNSRVGTAIDTADVNGDGFDDILAGAYGALNGVGANAGRVFIVHGHSGPFAAVHNLTNGPAVAGSGYSVIDGVDWGDTFGWSVGRAGDYDGDGIEDIVASAPAADPNGNSSGQVWLIYGDTALPQNIDLSTLSAQDGIRFDGDLFLRQAGFSVDGAGDFNNDGNSDLLIGTPGIDGNNDNIPIPGRAHLIFGQTGRTQSVVPLAGLNGSDGFTMNGVDAGDRTGRSVSNAGDMNADGFDDLLIGARGADPNGQRSGESYLIFGHENSMPPAIDLADLDGGNGITFNGIDAEDRSGYSVSHAGDVNADGFADFLVTAALADVDGFPQVGESFLVFGDPVERPLAGWTIYLDLNQNGAFDSGEPSTVTGTGGGYSFTGLVPGTYTIAEAGQVGWIQTTPGLPSQTHTVTLAAGDVATDIDFGHTRLNSGMQVEAVSPTSESHVAGGGNDITVTFSNPVDPATVSDASVVIHARETARLLDPPNAISTAGSHVTINPAADLHPGELVQITATRDIFDATGTQLTTALVSQFRVSAGAGPAHFVDSGALQQAFPSYGAALGDLNGDGHLDAFVANDGSDTVWFNNGNGTLIDAGKRHDAARARDVVLGDMDADGDLDALVANTPTFNNRNQVWLNDGTGNFQALPNLPVGSDALALGDLDGDGDPDAIGVAHVGPDAAVVLLNQGNAQFTSSPIPGAAISGNSDVALGDLDMDGDLDAVITNLTGPGTVWLNDGNGTFQNAGTLGSSAGVAITLGDVDNDGDVDVVTSDGGTDNRVWFNDGQATFTVSVSVPTIGFVTWTDLSLGDFDGDDDLDLFLTGTGAFMALLNDGTGNFTHNGQLEGPQDNHAVALGDVDGDGDVDAFLATSSENRVWRNQVPLTAPVADAGGPYTVREGSGVVLDASGTFDAQTMTFNLDYQWDLDGDGVFGETGAAAANGTETGSNPPFLAAGMDGPDVRTASLLVTDPSGLSDLVTFDITIENVVPRLSRSLYYSAGTADQYDPSNVELTTPSAGLNTFLQSRSVQVKDYDDFGINEFFGESFENLPAGIVGGELQITLQPGGDQPSTDSLHIGIFDELTGNPVERWAARLNPGQLTSLLPAPWHPGNYPNGTTLTFDLDNLPPIPNRPTSLINAIDTHGKVDLYIQDDTGIDFIDLRIDVEGPLIPSEIFEDEVVTITGRIADLGVPDTFTLDVDWGHPASPNNVQVLNFGTAPINSGGVIWNPATFEFEITHRYLDDDPTITSQDLYNVSFTITDDDLGQSSFSTTALVKNVAPEITALTVNSPVNEGGSLDLGVSFTDPGTLDEHTALIEWGDGTTSTVNVPVGQRIVNVSHVYPDDDPAGTPVDSYTIEVTLTDDDSGVDTATTAIDVFNLDPVISPLIAKPVVLDENGSVTISGTFTDAGILDTHVVNVDWGDGSTSQATLTQGAGFGSFTASHQYLDDNPTGVPSAVYTITATVIDDDTGHDSALINVTVNNVAPEITDLTSDATLLNKANPGQLVAVSGVFVDVGKLDSHSATIDWGDGSPTQNATVVSANGSGTISASHTFAGGGVYTITVTLTDDDGGIDVKKTTAVVTGVSINNGVLQIVGTANADHVTVNKQGNGLIKVHADFLPSGNFVTFPLSGIGSIEIVLCAGDDHATIAGNITLPAAIDGGPGDDHLNGGGGTNVIIGAEGNDHINGGSVRDVLIGGLGRDRLVGEKGDDLLIGDRTAYDSSGPHGLLWNLDALYAIRDAWNAPTSISDRRNTLESGVGIGNSFSLRFQSGATVFDDGERDRLTGSSGTDWFLLSSLDVATDFKSKLGDLLNF